ncbi:MAG: FMN-binding negative transcriptional regulator, partial [Pseudomonadota bacterium]
AGLAKASDVGRIIQATQEALVVFTGPDAYVSADWLGEPDSLPYWNYLSAEARGKCGPLSDQALIATYHDMSARYEKREHPSAEEAVALRIYAEQMKDMAGFDMVAESFVGVRKLSQDKKRQARAQAGEKLANAGGDRAIAAMMMNQGN